MFYEAEGVYSSFPRCFRVQHRPLHVIIDKPSEIPSKYQYNLGKLDFTPSFTPGVYSQGDGKDLGHTIEFKSEIQLSLNLLENSQFGMSYNHISNASLGKKNPGANSYMFNYLQKF